MKRPHLFAPAWLLLGASGLLFAQADQPRSEPNRARSAFDPDEPIVGCGKSRAAIRGFLSEQEAIPEPAYLETLAETDVLHYDLSIEITNINPSLNRCTLSGSNTITIQSKSAALTAFTFRLRSQFTIFTAVINGSTPVTVQQVSTSTRRAILDRTYGMDETFTLTINYTGTPVTAAFGSFEVDTQPFSGIPVIATLSEPYYAYTWWPVKDGDIGLPGDNSDKSTLDIAVTVPSAYQVASNGLLQGVDVLSGARSRYRWSSDYPIATYLVSFSATTYNTWTADYDYAGGSMPVEFYIYPPLDSPANRAGWEKAIAMLAIFGDKYGAYPFINEKYGLYNFPFGGGMEHQTMTGQGGFSESLTAHELAHQWWGDAITCKTWSDIWLNEGFATFSECLWQEFKGGGDDFALYRGCIGSRKPSNVGDSVYVYPADTSDVFRIFDTNMSYYKGAWVLHQLRGVVGDATFFDILANYRAAYEHGAPTTDDFAAVASQTYGADLTWFFQQWVYDIGAPAYQYGWSTTTVDGQDYLLLRIAQAQSASYPDAFTMPVRIPATSNAGTEDVRVWNDARTQWFVVPTNDAVTSVAFDPDQWILRTSVSQVAYAPGPPKLIATDPRPESQRPDQLVTELTLTFHTPVDVPPDAISVVGDSNGAVPFTVVSASGVNPVHIVFDAALRHDEYTVTILDSVTASNSGLALDGELDTAQQAEAFPSGDGVPGGSASFRFRVDAPIPATSSWGLLCCALLLLVSGTLQVRSRVGIC